MTEQEDKTKEQVIVITPANIHLVEFKDIVVRVSKNTTVDGEKIPLLFDVKWEGKLAKTSIEQASFKQAVLFYNNNRPIEDLKVMTTAECLRRKDLFRKMKDKPFTIDAVAQQPKQGKTRQLSPIEQVELINAEKDPKVKAYMKEALEKQQKDLLAAMSMIK